MSQQTQNLIKDIELKDRQFRLTQSVFMILLMLVLSGVVFLQYRTLQRVQVQLDRQKQIATQNAAQNQKQQDTIIRRLDCITAFFTRRDRTNITITDIDKCTLNTGSTPQQFFEPSAAAGRANTAPQPVSPPRPASSSPASSPAPSPATGPTQPQNPSLLDRILAPVKGLL